MLTRNAVAPLETGTVRGSPDTAARALEGLDVDELDELLLTVFFRARRARLLEDGPYGKRCAAIDLNELFKSTKRHGPDCQVREKTELGADGEKRKVTEYFHQAVALIWIDGERSWPLGWELLRPGEGELTAAWRLLRRLLPRLRGSLDLVLGDRLYSCRPFFDVVCSHGIDALAVSSGHTELDREMDELMADQAPRDLLGAGVAAWQYESEAWKPELKRTLRIAHYERRYPAKPWKKERSHLRVITSAPVSILPCGQGWRVGRARWRIENAAFNLLTRELALDRNFHHHRVAILALLVLRSMALAIMDAYRRFATARSAKPPRRLKWFQEIFVEDWVRYLDGARDGVALDSG